MSRRTPCVVLLMLLTAFSCRKPEEWYSTAGSGLVLRGAPSATATKLIVIPYRAKFLVEEKGKVQETISGSTGVWLKVQYQGIPGWVFSGFASMTPPPEIRSIGNWFKCQGSMALSKAVPADYAWRLRLSPDATFSRSGYMGGARGTFVESGDRVSLSGTGNDGMGGTFRFAETLVLEGARLCVSPQPSDGPNCFCRG